MATLFDFGRKLITKSKDFGKSLVPPKQPYMANTKQREKIRLAREAAFDKQIKTGAAVTTVGGTAAYLMSGDAEIGPVNKPSPTSLPARTPIADAPTKEFIDWRDRPSRADARKTFSKSTSSVPERKGISSSGRSESVLPTMTVTSKGPKYRDVRSGRTTATQESKFRFRKAKAEKEARKAKTQSIAKPAEISKRYELTPKQAGDKLLNTASRLFPKKAPPAYKNPNAFTDRDLIGTDGMSASEIKKRFNTKGYVTPKKPALVQRPGETDTSFAMRKQRVLAQERRAALKNK